MARKLKSKAVSVQRIGSTNRKVIRHEVDSAPLIEISHDSEVWKALPSANKVKTLLAPMFKRDAFAICKVTPPAGAPDTEVAQLVGILEAFGALAVRVMPSPPADQVVSHDFASDDDIFDLDAKPLPPRSLMQVAVDRAQRSNSGDVDALVELVQVAMTKAENAKAP